MRVEPTQVNQLLLPRFDPEVKDQGREGQSPAGQGPQRLAGRRRGQGRLRCRSRRRSRPRRQARHPGAPRDLALTTCTACSAAKGILTQRGGATSHAAVVARGLGLPCVAGCESLRVDDERGEFTVHVDGKQSPLRKATSSPSTAPPARSSTARSAPSIPISTTRRTSRPCSSGPTRPSGWACGPTRDYPRDAVSAPQVRRRGHRPVPHRAHVLRDRAPAHRAADDPGQDGERARRVPSMSCCPSSAATSRASSRR